mmetsp:Transcript_59344/g.185993  ORF Transcript_59344/g.185993 Transcript_59344/m.185993 type:complete len:238 (+) Transcript_59344:139-852(+)
MLSRSVINRSSRMGSTVKRCCRPCFPPAACPCDPRGAGRFGSARVISWPSVRPEMRPPPWLRSSKASRHASAISCFPRSTSAPPASPGGALARPSTTAENSVQPMLPEPSASMNSNMRRRLRIIGAIGWQLTCKTPSIAWRERMPSHSISIASKSCRAFLSWRSSAARAAATSPRRRRRGASAKARSAECSGCTASRRCCRPAACTRSKKLCLAATAAEGRDSGSARRSAFSRSWVQ